MFEADCWNGLDYVRMTWTVQVLSRGQGGINITTLLCFSISIAHIDDHKVNVMGSAAFLDLPGSPDVGVSKERCRLNRSDRKQQPLQKDHDKKATRGRIMSWLARPWIKDRQPRITWSTSPHRMSQSGQTPGLFRVVFKTFSGRYHEYRGIARKAT